MAENSEEQQEHGAPAQTDAAAAAIALASALQTRELDPRAAAYLRKQGKFVEQQSEHLHEQRPLLISHLRWQRFSDRVWGILLILALIVGTAIVGLLASAVWQAWGDEGVVIEAFSVPPDLAQKGFTGQVVAAKFLDRLTALQYATDSARPPGTFTNNWGSDIKVEIPETGISLADLNHYLRETLGHITHITGEVVRTSSGIAVTVRAGDEPGTTVDGSEADLDKLMQQAAEHIYERTQPYRFGVYLFSGLATNQVAERRALKVFRKLIHSPDKGDHAWAYIGLGDVEETDGDFTDALANFRQGTALDSALDGTISIAALEQISGHDEAALSDYETGAHQSWNVVPSAATIFIANTNAMIAQYRGDHAEAARLFLSTMDMENHSGLAALAPALAAQALANAHDPAHASETLTGAGMASDVDAMHAADYAWQPALPFYAIAAARGDWHAARDGLLKLKAALPKMTAVARQIWKTSGQPDLAYSEAKLGNFAQARGAAAITPMDCYLCLRRRGQIEALQKNWPQAGHWFDAAVKQAPSLPFAYSDWGAALMTKGDLDDAIAKFTAANQKGPHFADPLEMWGEALIAKNRSDLALGKFEDANKHAPNWGRLHLKWGEALQYTGDKAGARKQFAIAAHLNLAAAERKELVEAVVTKRHPKP
ncbi:MAG TPA: hypothetical protein VHW02_06680 [Rhizomicrobium sp.]|nr:hypothetical protein [Rhizomicrobium sp.]